MRWASRLGVPRAGAAVHQILFRLVPRPSLHQAVHPQVQVEAPLVAVDVAHLLLSRPPDLLLILEHLLLGVAIRHRLQDLYRRHLQAGAEERDPAVLLLDDHHADHAPRRTPRRQEGLDRLGHLLAVLHALHLLPAARLACPLGQADPLLAVGSLWTPLARRLGQRQRTQSRVLAQTAHHGEAGSLGPLEERLLGVAAIDDHPKLLEVVFYPRLDPVQLFDGHLQLGAKDAGTLGGQLGQIDLADVELALQGQRDGAPVLVLGQGRQGHPDVAVDVLATGGTGARVVVDAAALDPGAVAT